MSSLPHIPPEEYPYIVEQDPMEPRRRIRGRRQGRRRRRRPRSRSTKKPKPKPVRTAMSIEFRDGVLCVFMPPVEKVEDYLELIAAVEATAEEMQIAGSYRGLWAALRPARRGDQGDARSRRDRDQRPAGAKLARGRRHHLRPVRRRRKSPARRQPFSGRRPPHRHRRRQSCRGRRLDAAGFAVPAPARSLEEPGAVLAAPSVAVLSVLRHVHRPDQPGAAHRRSAP